MPNPVEFISNLLQYTTIHYSSPSTAFPLRICKTLVISIFRTRDTEVSALISAIVVTNRPPGPYCAIELLSDKERGPEAKHGSTRHAHISYTVHMRILFA